uniref:Putative secreted protein n=1 Tax=Ixodes ricinus TaxID=34613 RepID=A0A6B0U4P5_IXORI
MLSVCFSTVAQVSLLNLLLCCGCCFKRKGIFSCCPVLLVSLRIGKGTEEGDITSLLWHHALGKNRQLVEQSICNLQFGQ